MAVTKAKEYKGYYIGNLSNMEIDAIESIRQCECIENLKHTIYQFDDELIEKSIKSDKSIRDLIRNGEVYTENLYGELKDTQTVAVGFLYWSKRSLLGDAVGSGKTVITASLINYLYAKKEIVRFIFFADSATSAKQVQKELIKFTGLHIGLMPSQADPMDKYISKTDWTAIDGIVTTHSALKSDKLMNWLAKFVENDRCKIFDTVFLDESSVIKNKTTKVFRYATSLIDKVDRVHFLNATSFETCIMDIYNQIDVLRNELLPKSWRIEQNYCVFKTEPYWITQNGKPTQKFKRSIVDYKNQEDFKEKLKMVYFGRSKQDLGLNIEHKYKVYSTYPTVQQLHEINRGGNYNQILNCPTLLEKTEINFNVKDVPKLAMLLDLLKNEFNGKSVLIYCFNVDAMRVIKEECIRIGKVAEIINGSTPDNDRVTIKDNFNNGKVDIVITNVKRSLNMYGGDVCIWYTYTGNPATMEQIRGRIDRNIDDSVKTFVLLLYKNTPEYSFFTEIAGQRARSNRELTIDADTCIDYFLKEIQEDREEVKCY